jgi:hypothetical protein
MIKLFAANLNNWALLLQRLFLLYYIIIISGEIWRRPALAVIEEI